MIGVSVLSGSHLPLVAALKTCLDEIGLGDIPVVVGGIIPETDAESLKKMASPQSYTPKDFELNSIIKDIVSLADPGGIAAE